MSPDVRPKISARARLQTDAISGKPVLLYPEGVLMLNKTGHAIISLCDGSITVEDIGASLAKRFQGISIQQMRTDICKYLEALQARNLLELIANKSES